MMDTATRIPTSLTWGTCASWLACLGLLCIGAGGCCHSRPAESPGTTAQFLPRPGSSRPEIVGRVLDARSGAPIEDAVVYLGACGSVQVRTDADGLYRIEMDTYGSYGLAALKRGYSRVTQVVQLAPGQKMELDLALSPSVEPPKRLQLAGHVALAVAAEGTRSERRWYELHGSDGQSVVLFDEVGCSTSSAFGAWVGQSVIATGFEDTGKVGWDAQPTPGLFVESLRADE